MDFDKVKENQHCCFIVSEPWDYINPACGGNYIYGAVIKAEKDFVVFKSDNTIEIAGVRGDTLLLLPRYYEQADKADFFDCTYNTGIILCKYDASATRSDLEKNAKYVFIGSFKR